MRGPRRYRRGMSLIELLMASALLLIAVVPITDALWRGAALARDIQMRTKATLLAQQEMEAALALAADDFTRDPGKSSAPLGDGYLVTVTGVAVGLTKTISVQVGWDRDKSGSLGSTEVLVALKTIAANVGS